MISVVIPAYNEAEHIRACLASFTKQTTTRPFEVIVVDNASTDQTARIAKTFQASFPLRVIAEPYKGRGAARRKGFELAKGDIILSTDADTVVPEDWVDEMAMQLTTSDAAITGYVTWTDGPKWINTLGILFQPIATYAHRVWMGHHWLVGSNFAIWANIYKKSGGFNKTLEGVEDIDLSTKVSKLGRIRLVSSPKVVASPRRFEKGFHHAVWAYIRTSIEYLILRKSHIALSDVR